MPHSAIPMTGRPPAASRTACRPGSLKQAMTNASASSCATSDTRGMTTLSESRWVAIPGGPSRRSVTSSTGPPVRRSGCSAASIAAVTAAEELGLMVRMRLISA